MDVTCNLEQKININDKLINKRKLKQKKFLIKWLRIYSLSNI